jgi:Prokaryotic E2 family E
MDERRLDAEGEFLKQFYPGSRTGVDRGRGTGWFYIPDFSMPTGWNSRTSELLIVVPAGYPQVPPESFFLQQDLRDSQGRSVAHYYEQNMGQNPYHDRNWAWFCYHVKSHSWRPAVQITRGDSLATYATLVYQGLKGVVT